MRNILILHRYFYTGYNRKGTPKAGWSPDLGVPFQTGIYCLHFMD